MNMKLLKKSARSKTIWFAVLLAVFGAIQTSFGLFSDLLDPKTYGILTMTVGVIVAVLRVITTLPLEDK